MTCKSINRRHRKSGDDMKNSVHHVLSGDSSGWIGRAVTTALTALIALTVVGFVLETVESVQEVAGRAFHIFEVVSVSIFSVEYVVRVWACTSDPNYSHPLRGRLRFMVSPLLLVDLLAILPFYVGLFGTLGMDLRILRALRLVARSSRLGHHSEGIRTLGRVLQAKSNELLTVVAVLIVLLILASALMYYAENNAQAESFSSIPTTAWWGIVTLTTVGYGDMAPITGLGRVIAGVMAILGIGLFALPAGILGSGFMQEVESKRPIKYIVVPTAGESCECGKLLPRVSK